MTKTPSPRAKRAERKADRAEDAPSPPLAATTPATDEPDEDGIPTEPKGKLGLLVKTLRTPGGVTLHDLGDVTGWQLHSVRGAMAGALKQRGYAIHSRKEGAGPRLYSLAEAVAG